MPVVFNSTPGRVVVLQPYQATAAQLSIYNLDPGISFVNERAIITGISISRNVNAQFLHTLGSFVHIYVFGDRIGEVAFNGIAFAKGCDNRGRDGTGFEKILQWYRKNKASRRSRPIRLTIGRQVMEGFITGLTTQVADPYHGLVEFNITMPTLPED